MPDVRDAVLPADPMIVGLESRGMVWCYSRNDCNQVIVGRGQQGIHHTHDTVAVHPNVPGALT